MQRDRVVDQGGDPALPKRGHEGVTPGVAHHEEVMDRPRLVLLGGKLDPRPFQLAPIEAGERAPSLGPRREVPQAHPQDRCLHLVEAAVDPGLLVAVPVALAAVAETAQTCRDVRLGHQQRSSVPERT